MYTLSKAVTALQLASQLNLEERPVVSVFWVASQDHDMDEIRSATLLGPNAEFRSVSLPFPEGLPAGRSAWNPDWTEQVDAALAELYGEGAVAAEARALARAAAEPEGTIADVFARTLSALLGPQGLIILDPTDPSVAALCKPTLLREAASPSEGPGRIRAAGQALKEMGYRPQLGRAEDATNLFLQREAEPRRLLRWDGRRFHPDGDNDASLSYDDIAQILEDDPVAVTPAAGLRPIVQDALLPTVAVVVGPGELRYFAQLSGVYEHHDVVMPLVWPRATATLLEPPAVRILARHQLEAATFQNKPDEMLEQRILELHGHGKRFESAVADLELQFAELLREVEAIDPTLQGTVQRGRTILERTVEKLRGKTSAALLQRDRVTHDQFKRLRSMLLPGGQPQERIISPFAYFARFGVGPIMARMMELRASGDHALPIDPDVQD